MLKLITISLAGSVSTLLISHSVLAGGGDDKPIDDNSNTNQNTSSVSLNSNSLPVLTQSYENYGYSLNSPSCRESCVYGVGKLSRNFNGDEKSEILVGVNINLNRSVQHKLAEATVARMSQQDEISLAKELSHAIENCEHHYVKLLSVAAAKRLEISREEILSLTRNQNCKTSS